MPSPTFSKVFALVLFAVDYVCGFEQKIMCGSSFNHAFRCLLFTVFNAQRLPFQSGRGQLYSHKQHHVNWVNVNMIFVFDIVS